MNYIKRVIVFSILSVATPLAFAGKGEAENYIETEIYTQEDNDAMLALFKELRVADVADGMHSVGLPHTGFVDPAIHADWLDRKTMKHVIRGIAVTVRYVPTQRSEHPAPGQAFSEWEGNFYNEYSSEPFADHLFPGAVVMIDDVEERDIGSIGSYNILAWKDLGAVGVITDAGSRDTDEIALQEVPLYLRKRTRGIRPGRNEIESINRPLSFGGVLVMPGDVVVADGDGVVVVPRAVAKDVAAHAQKVLDGDKAGRRSLYEQMGIPLDQTVE
ncbi:hypothetical protein [Pelagicoccus sp. SDUM812002]|uniref:RraA family protein n=1 Tax=Pelagicoccus sp. SDUM812002 TaxID=3041266 RepID=UPI00280FA78C|nr:hypothetical protein [Pelagicoccus sp. SDUM812002]MDQ8187454.1 hypothetical protein [Pelagicoccus sp. SDUM812002]